MPDAPLPPREPRLPASAELRPATAAPDDDSSLDEAELGAVDLTGRSFDLVDARGCRFTGTRLSGSRWRRCSLHDCELAGCDLANVALERTSLRRVRITGTRLTGFTIGTTRQWDLVLGDCQAELSVWRLARLERAAFRGCRLTRSDWGGATLTDVTFEDCDLGGADFSGCRMRSVIFRGCQYDGIRGLDGLRGATVHVGDLPGLEVAMAGQLGIRVQAEAVDL